MFLRLSNYLYGVILSPAAGCYTDQHKSVMAALLSAVFGSWHRWVEIHRNRSVSAILLGTSGEVSEPGEAECPEEKVSERCPGRRHDFPFDRKPLQRGKIGIDDHLVIANREDPRFERLALLHDKALPTLR